MLTFGQEVLLRIWSSLISSRKKSIAKEMCWDFTKILKEHLITRSSHLLKFIDGYDSDFQRYPGCSFASPLSSLCMLLLL